MTAPRSCSVLWFLVLGVASCTAAPEPIRVMSYNVRYGTAADGPNRWENRAAIVLRPVTHFLPDILGLQEALDFQVDHISAALPGYEYVGVGRDDGRTAGEFVPIFYRTDRFAEVSHGHFWFSGTPDAPGSADWGNSITRMCTWILLDDLASGRRLAVFNVHWDHESQPSRERSAALLAERITSVGETPVVVLGDFNSGPDNPAILALTRGDGRGAGLTDAYFSLHPDGPDLGTFHGFTGRTAGQKIDAVLVGPGWSVEAASIDRTEFDGSYPSDHFPVTAVLR